MKEGRPAHDGQLPISSTVEYRSIKLAALLPTKEIDVAVNDILPYVNKTSQEHNRQAQYGSEGVLLPMYMTGLLFLQEL